MLGLPKTGFIQAKVNRSWGAPLLPMTKQDAQFERELEVFRTEVAAGTQFFYAYLAVHAVAADRQPVNELLNRAPLFWNTCLAALQTAAFIALGRIFDQDSAHNLDRVLRFAQDSPQMFSRAALGRRKQGNNPQSPEWLDEYLRNAYEPTSTDFRRIRAHIRKRRKTYENNYRDLRNKVFAHKAVRSRQEQLEADVASAWKRDPVLAQKMAGTIQVQITKGPVN